MQQQVYIETTIPSFFFTHRQDVESRARRNWTRQWWDGPSLECSIVTSAATIAELRRGKGDLVEERVELLKDVKLLPITSEVEVVAETYIRNMVMPKDPQGDALHLAIASFYRVDVLLTWNCIHLANANKFWSDSTDQ